MVVCGCVYGSGGIGGGYLNVGGRGNKVVYHLRAHVGAAFHFLDKSDKPFVTGFGGGRSAIESSVNNNVLPRSSVPITDSVSHTRDISNFVLCVHSLPVLALLISHTKRKSSSDSTWSPVKEANDRTLL